jgi:hypothetical protein
MLECFGGLPLEQLQQLLVQQLSIDLPDAERGPRTPPPTDGIPGRQTGIAERAQRAGQAGLLGVEGGDAGRELALVLLAARREARLGGGEL